MATAPVLPFPPTAIWAIIASTIEIIVAVIPLSCAFLKNVAKNIE